jgi:hypothetical protein
MSIYPFVVLPLVALLQVSAVAAQPVILSEHTYKPDLGVILMHVNWGRTWKCGPFENAQLLALSFTRLPTEGSEPTSLELETPSRLLVDNKFLQYAYVVQPGEYAISAFDVKAARSVKDIVHIKAEREDLIKDGKPSGGSFTVGPGEIVYTGHFGLDCGAEPFLWRYYIESREEFERYVGSFRQKFAFLRSTPVEFRLFSTQMLGRPYSLRDSTVK